jgi:hypothetical protein
MDIHILSPLQSKYLDCLATSVHVHYTLCSSYGVVTFYGRGGLVGNMYVVPEAIYSPHSNLTHSRRKPHIRPLAERIFSGGGGSYLLVGGGGGG